MQGVLTRKSCTRVLTAKSHPGARAGMALFLPDMRGASVELAALVAAAHRLLELAHAGAELAPEVRELLRAQHDERQGEDDDDFHGADAGHGRSPSVSGWSPERARARPAGGAGGPGRDGASRARSPRSCRGGWPPRPPRTRADR